MLRFGTIQKSDPAKGLFRVEFSEDGLVSAWLPVLVRNSKQNKDENWLDVGEHVACMMDENCENGVIMGAIYSNTDAPEEGDKDVRRITFGNGAYISFNRNTSKLLVKGFEEVDVTDSKNVSVKADTKIIFEAPDVEVKGKLKVTQAATFQDKIDATGNIKSSTGNIEATVGDVKAMTVSLKTHVHGGVTSGYSSTAAPTP